MQEVAADVVSSVTHRRGGQAGSWADVASPRPREVGGACRIQVLATARTQETVGGPNGAKRSEFRRSCPAVDVTLVRRAHRRRQWCQATARRPHLTWTGSRRGCCGGGWRCMECRFRRTSCGHGAASWHRCSSRERKGRANLSSPRETNG